MKFLDKIPLVPLLIIAILMGLAPFKPEPHLLQKLSMLADGSLGKPIDIFDLAIHGLPVLLLAAKLLRMTMKGSEKTEGGEAG